MKKSSLLFAASLAAILTLLIWALSLWSLFLNAENVTLKWRYTLRYYLQKPQLDPRIVLVSIDDQSQAELQNSWPFPRDWHAQLAALLTVEKPAVVAWDILFTDPKRDTPDKDALLVQAAKQLPHFISGAGSENSSRINPPLDQLGPNKAFTRVTGDLSKLPATTSAQLPFDDYTHPVTLEDGTTSTASVSGLLRNTEFAFVNSDPDNTGLRKNLPLVVLYQGKLFPALPLLAAMDFYGISVDDVSVALGQEITLSRPNQSPIHIPINDCGEFLVNFQRTIADFPGIPYSKIGKLLYGKNHLEEAKAQNPEFETDLKHLPPLTGNIVMFGFTGKGFDTGATPLEELTPMVNVHLNALANILEQDFLYSAPAWQWTGALFLILLLLFVILLRVNLVFILPIGFFSIAAYFAMSYGLFQYRHLLIPTTLPMIGLLVVTLLATTKLYFGEESQKRQIKAAMAAYLPEKVMQRVLEHPDRLKLGGDNRELSILFCDIRGFTKYCDGREPEAVVGVLNEYMEVMSNVIFKYEGTIDKYIGDCIMAFWNAPEDQPDHAQRAVCCAMEMRYALANYKTQRAGIDTEIFECGIGIHTGPALVGNVGSTKRLSYTAIGAAVNMAARLESLTKRFTSRIIISAATLAQIDKDQFTVTDLGEVLVPGFAQKIHLYSVEALQDISAALLVGKKVAHQSNVTVAHVDQPMWAPAPLPDDAEVDSEGKG